MRPTLFSVLEFEPTYKFACTVHGEGLFFVTSDQRTGAVYHFILCRNYSAKWHDLSGILHADMCTELSAAEQIYLCPQSVWSDKISHYLE